MYRKKSGTSPVDTLGQLLAVHVTPANEQEPAQAALDEGIEFQVIKLPEAKKGFVLLPGR